MCRSQSEAVATVICSATMGCVENHKVKRVSQDLLSKNVGLLLRLNPIGQIDVIGPLVSLV